ncbi:DUF4836 family protein [Rapidithrix thailandica]|uniref:DUF4836 family protein n=1 Tax=Rapidithrix thailandica TaxID=413964 RepID=A0AAW9S9H9_9BACT
MYKFELMRKASILLTVLLFSYSLGYGQNLSQKIPEDALIVFSINAEQVRQKADMESLMEMEFIQQIEQELSKSDNQALLSAIYSDPQSIGLNAEDGYYYFMQANDSMLYMNFLFGISDKAHFDNFVSQTFLNGITPTQEEKTSYFSTKTLGIRWDEQYALFVGGVPLKKKSIYSQVDYDDPEYDQKIDALREERDTWLSKQWLEHLKASETKKSLMKESANFNNFIDKAPDLGLWGNWKVFQLNLIQGLKEVRELRNIDQVKLFESLNALLGGNYLHMYGNFENGKITLETQQYLSEKLAKLSEGMYDKRPNPEYLKYIDKNNLIGFYSMAIDIEKLVNMTWTIYKPFLESIPEYGPMAHSSMEILGLLLDEQALYNLMKGDLVLSISAMMEVEREYTSYEYDEDFNYTEIKKTKKEAIPEFTALMGIGNKENFEIILRALLRTKILQPTEDGLYYEIRAKELPIAFYLAIQDDIILLTNNTSLLDKKVLKKGLKKKYRLEKERAELMTENAQSLYLDIPRLLTNLEKIEKANSKELTVINKLKEEADNMNLVGVKVEGNKLTSNFELVLQNDKQNSLKILTQLMNFLFHL